jgi:hypothetical protein
MEDIGTNRTLTSSKNINKKVLMNRGLMKEILRLVSLGHTKQKICRRLDLGENIVGVCLYRLKKKGVVKQISRGVYEIVNFGSGTQPTSLTNDYFRLHNLQICLKLSNDTFKGIKNVVFSDRSYYKVHSLNGSSDYFEYQYTGLITTENIFIYFPEDFEVLGKSIAEVYYLFEKEVKRVLSKWEQRFNISLFKEGRVNYEITNQHLSHVENGIAKEINSQKDLKNQVKVYDDTDGKTALMFDASKGFNEAESPHPSKAPFYIDNMKDLIERIKRNEIRKLFDEHYDLKVIVSQQNLILNRILNPSLMADNVENKDRPEYVG